MNICICRGFIFISIKKIVLQGKWSIKKTSQKKIHVTLRLILYKLAKNSVTALIKIKMADAAPLPWLYKAGGAHKAVTLLRCSSPQGPLESQASSCSLSNWD